MDFIELQSINKSAGVNKHTHNFYANLFNFGLIRLIPNFVTPSVGTLLYLKIHQTVFINNDALLAVDFPSNTLTDRSRADRVAILNVTNCTSLFYGAGDDL